MHHILSVEEEFKSEIDMIWSHNRYSEIEVIQRGYGIHDKIIKNSILFIGINPSFTKNSAPGNYFINLDQNGRTAEGKSYPYFNKFVDLTNRLNEKRSIGQNLRWSHMDLLFHRETKQYFIEDLKKQKNGIEFLSKQLNISKKILLKSKPKLIVVANTMARDFIKSKNDKFSFGFDFKFDEILGTELIINNSELENTPVFFTSMLTGQRALDVGSYNRLIWHINYVLNKINPHVSV